MRYVKIGLPEAKRKSLSLIANFSRSVGCIGRAWRWLVGGLNCFKAAEHRSERTNKIPTTVYYKNNGKIKVTVFPPIYGKEQELDVTGGEIAKWYQQKYPTSS